MEPEGSLPHSQASASYPYPGSTQCRPIHNFYHISLNSSWNEKCFKQNLWRKSKHTFCVHFFKSCLLWDNNGKNIVDLYTPQVTIWCMCITCWILKAKNTHSAKCNNYYFTTSKMVERKRLDITLYVRCLSSSHCVIYPRFRMLCKRHIFQYLFS